jgi:vacuolar protein sorting-associated protein 13A/C
MLFSIARLVLKGNNTEMSADVLGLTMESNGIRILEPFDTSLKYSNASGKTNIHISVSDIFMNFTFSILRLFLAVEDDILSFLRMTSKKMTIVCSHFDKVGIIKSILIFSILFLFWVNMLATVLTLVIFLAPCRSSY